MASENVSINFTVNGLRDIDRLEKSLKRTQRDFKTLDSFLNKGRITAQQYSKAIQNLNLQEDQLNAELKEQTALLGSNYAGMVRNTKGVKDFAGAAGSAAKSAEALARAQRLSGKSTNRFGMISQQFGYQIGDFFVQVQSGTNAVLAFGQQATQLAGLLPGLAGAIIGVGISLGTMLVGNFLRAQASTEELTKKIRELKKEVRELESGGIPTEVLDAYAAAEDADSRRIEAQLALFEQEDKLAELRRQGLQDSSLLLQNQEAAVIQAKEELDAAIQAREEVGKQIIEWQELQRRREAASQMLELEAEIGKDALAVMKRAGVDFSKTISDTTIEAAKLAEFLGISLQDALAMVKLSSSVLPGAKQYSGRGGDPRQFGGSGNGYSSAAEYLNSTKPDKKSGGSSRGPRQDSIERLQKELDLREKLFFKTKEYSEVAEAAAKSEKAYSEEVIVGLAKRIENLNKLEQIRSTMESSFEDGFMSIVEGTKSVEDAFKDMAKAVISELYRVYVVQKMVSQIGGLFNIGGGGGVSISKSLMSSVGSAVGMPSFSGGGYTGSGSRSGGIDGMGGFPAILHPNETVVDHTKGQSMGQVNLTQVININGNGDEFIQRKIAEAAPAIGKMSVDMVMKERRKGGAMAATFGR